MNNICISKMFSLLQQFAPAKRKVAPEIYKNLILLLLESDKNTSARNRIIQGFIYLFLQTDIPTVVLLDTYLKHFQTNQGVTFEINVFDLDFLKMLVRDSRITLKLQIQFFDIFCKIMISTMFGTSIMEETISLSIELIEKNSDALVFKFIEVGLQFYSTTYKSRKIVPGQVHDLTKIQMHKRAVICKYIIIVLPRINNQDFKNKVKDKTLKTYIEINTFYTKDKKKQNKGERGKIQGLREILALFGDADAIIEKYMRDHNIYYGSDEAAIRNSMSPLSNKSFAELDNLSISQINQASRLKDQSLIKNGENPQLTKQLSIQDRRLLAERKKAEKSQQLSKLDQYLKLREKGIEPDPVGIAKLEEFKEKLREKQLVQYKSMMKEKVKEIRVKESLYGFLEQRRLELGISSSFAIHDEAERMIIPLGEYEKNKKKYEVDTGIPDLELFDMGSIEKIDAEAAKDKLHHFRKLFRMFFSQYAN